MRIVGSRIATVFPGLRRLDLLHVSAGTKVLLVDGSRAIASTNTPLFAVLHHPNAVLVTRDSTPLTIRRE